MKQERFDEIIKRGNGNNWQICYNLYCESFKVIPYDQFESIFSIWLQMYKGNNIISAIQYFKTNKIK